MSEELWKSDECKDLRRGVLRTSFHEHSTICILLTIIAFFIGIMFDSFNNLLVLSVIVSDIICMSYSMRIDYISHKYHFIGYMDAKFEEGDDFFEED